MSIIPTTSYRRRFVWIGAILLLSLTLFTAWYVLANQGATTPWTNYYVAQDRKAISAVIDWPLVAWVDSTEPQTSKILVKNLETGEIRDLGDELPCNVSATGRDDIALDGDWLVVIYNCYLPEPAKMYAYNLVTEELVWVEPPPGTPAEQEWPFEPAISGNRIVWQQEDWQTSDIDVYLFDLQSRTAISLTQTAPPWGESHADIDQDWVVWSKARFGTGEQYLIAFNLVSSETITVSLSGAPTTIAPSIQGDIFVWEDFRNSSMQADIYGYNLSVHQTFPIVISPNSQYIPDVEDGLVVYQETIAPQEYAIYVHDMAISETVSIFQTVPNQATQFQLKINNGVIVWIDDDLSILESDIYAAQQLPERRYLPFLRRP